MIASTPTPIRILHIVGILRRGGLETWLMHVLRTLDRSQIQVDFLVHIDAPGDYDAEVEALGCRILRCPLIWTAPWRYVQQFKKILRQGSYHIIHSHVHFFSGFTLRTAHQMKVPVRIAHSHVDTSPVSRQAGWLRRQYLELTQHWIDQYATMGLAASREAAQDLFGPNWEDDQRWQLLYYGVDLTPFQIAESKTTVRAELGIPEDAFVIGHVGRFEHQKNHQFLLEIAEQVYKRDPKTYLLMIGDGPLRANIEALATQSTLQDRILFAGVRSDIPRLMSSVMDIFLLPSFYEGLPLVGIEAQAAGLRLVLSDSITAELDAVPRLIDRVSLDQPTSVWAETILAARSQQLKNQSPTNNSLLALQSSVFNITQSAMEIESVYRTSVQSLELQTLRSPERRRL
jgi:glycosyltransferase involved in cell wall biosynthesis